MVEIKVTILVLVRSGIIYKISIDKIVALAIIIHLLITKQEFKYLPCCTMNYWNSLTTLAMNMETTNNQIITPKIMFQLNLSELSCKPLKNSPSLYF